MNILDKIWTQYGNSRMHDKHSQIDTPKFLMIHPANMQLIRQSWNSSFRAAPLMHLPVEDWTFAGCKIIWTESIKEDQFIFTYHNL